MNNHRYLVIEMRRIIRFVIAPILSGAFLCLSSAFALDYSGTAVVVGESYPSTGTTTTFSPTTIPLCIQNLNIRVVNDTGSSKFNYYWSIVGGGDSNWVAAYYSGGAANTVGISPGGTYSVNGITVGASSWPLPLSTVLQVFSPSTLVTTVQLTNGPPSNHVLVDSVNIVYSLSGSFKYKYGPGTNVDKGFTSSSSPTVFLYCSGLPPSAGRPGIDDQLQIKANIFDGRVGNQSNLSVHLNGKIYPLGFSQGHSPSVALAIDKTISDTQQGTSLRNSIIELYIDKQLIGFARAPATFPNHLFVVDFGNLDLGCGCAKCIAGKFTATLDDQSLATIMLGKAGPDEGAMSLQLDPSEFVDGAAMADSFKYFGTRTGPVEAIDVSGQGRRQFQKSSFTKGPAQKAAGITPVRR
jgi:hypothetical protein